MVAPLYGPVPYSLPPELPLPNGLGEVPAANGPASFQTLLLNSLAEVNAAQHSADEATELSLTGGDITQVETLTAMKKAELSLRMMLQVRNKLLEAYNEIKELRM